MWGQSKTYLDSVNYYFGILLNNERDSINQYRIKHKTGGKILNLGNTPIESLGSLQSVGGNLILSETPIKSLGNLKSVGGSLDLRNTPIESLGNLQYVGGNLYSGNTPIKSLGNLQSVGGDLDLSKTPISKKYSEQEILQMINVGEEIYF